LGLLPGDPFLRVVARTEVIWRTYRVVDAKTVPTCTNCGGRLVADRHELVCQDCGFVEEDNIIDDRASVENGGVEREKDAGGQTQPQIAFGYRDAARKPVDRRAAARLRKTASMFNLTPEEKAIRLIEKDIDSICGRLGLPPGVAGRAKVVRRRVREAGILKHADQLPLTKACILVACREQGIYRDEELFHHEKRSVALRYSNVINGKLDIKYRPQSAGKRYGGETHLIHFIELLLGGSEDRRWEVEREARRIIRSAKVQGNPQGIAAAAILLAAKKLGIAVKQKDISKATRISEDTIHKWRIALERQSELQVPAPS